MCKLQDIKISHLIVCLHMGEDSFKPVCFLKKYEIFDISINQLKLCNCEDDILDNGLRIRKKSTRKKTCVVPQIDSHDQMPYVERLQICSDNGISTLMNEKRKWIRTLIRNTNCQTCWTSAGLALIFFPVRLNRNWSKLMALRTFCLSAGFRSISACSGDMFSVAWEPPRCPFSWCAPFQFGLQWGTWSLLQSVSWCALGHR